MRRLTFENSRGEKIVFYLSPFLITSLTGIGEVDADVQGQKIPFVDGETYINTKLEPRYINLEGVIQERNLTRIREYRREINRVCNPKLGLGTITLELDGDIKIIRGVLDGGVVFPERAKDVWQKFLITWKCPNPYWQSPSITEEPAFEGLFEFPFEGEFEMGIQRDERIIYNDGDAPAPVQIIFYGPAQQPQIANLTTGEFIKINKYLYENEKLIVDTAEKSVYYEDEDGNRENVFHWLDLNSTFFNLEIGENEISCMCAVSNLTKDFEISYRKLYVGV